MDNWWVEWRHESAQERVPLAGTVTIGRAAGCDVVLDDPYVSRLHCTVSLVDGRPFVDARGALNPVVAGGREVTTATLGHGEAFTVGRTTFRLWHSPEAGEETLRLEPVNAAPALILRSSTRELVDYEGTLVAQFSASEYLAFAELARRFPDAANHRQLGLAVWGGDGFDQYQLHRLLQRIRHRLGDAGSLLENVRGAGYRLRAAVTVQ